MVWVSISQCRCPQRKPQRKLSGNASRNPYRYLEPFWVTQLPQTLNPKPASDDEELMLWHELGRTGSRPGLVEIDSRLSFPASAAFSGLF